MYVNKRVHPFNPAPKKRKRRVLSSNPRLQGKSISKKKHHCTFIVADFLWASVFLYDTAPSVCDFYLFPIVGLCHWFCCDLMGSFVGYMGIEMGMCKEVKVLLGFLRGVWRETEHFVATAYMA